MTKIKTNRNNTNNVPPLRFPEFSGEWRYSLLGNECNILCGYPFDGQDMQESSGNVKLLRGINIKEGEIRHSNELDRYYSGDISKLGKYILKEGDLVIGMDGSKVGRNSAILTICEQGSYLVQRVCRIRSQKHNVEYIFQHINNSKFHKYVDSIKTASAIPHISQSDIQDYTISFPPTAEEQIKITSLLSLLDARIATQNKIIEDLEQLKSAIRERLYTQIQEEDFEHKTIKDVLSYEHPTKYIVVDTEYTDDKKLTPVLTANKAFILGYTPEQENIYGKGDCIIFDDFTMDIKFVSFPFKIKSSAIKILTAKTNVNLYFIYEYLLFLNLISEEHKRHYISEIEPLHIVVPCLVIQHKIAEILQSIDKQIHNARQLQSAYQRQKQYLLNQMFI